jgi:hypothetical protein
MAEATHANPNPNPPEGDLIEEDEPQDELDREERGGRGGQDPRAPLEPHVTIVTMYNDHREPKTDHLHLILIKNDLFGLTDLLFRKKMSKRKMD